MWKGLHAGTNRLSLDRNLCSMLSVVCVPLQLSNSSLHDYMKEHIFTPLNLSNAFYWTGGLGMQPDGLHSGVVPMPGYYTTFKGK